MAEDQEIRALHQTIGQLRVPLQVFSKAVAQKYQTLEDINYFFIIFINIDSFTLGAFPEPLLAAGAGLQ